MKEEKKPKYSSKSEKSKTVAIVLAVFFGCWSWLYTYRENAWKFWVGLVISLTCWWMLFIPNFAVWVWALVDNTIKNDDWYKEYNNEKLK